MNASSTKTCPQCGGSLADSGPAGLCPRCLMALSFKTDSVLTGAEPAMPATPLPPEAIAPHFPQLEILECLGRGGMGVVYKARQKSLNRFVALKILAPERIRDPQFAVRFSREAQALAALDHPNIVTVYDFGQVGGFYYLLMEFVDGVSLRQLLRERPCTPEEALAIVPAICEALQFAHDRGIVHRDIKPENILLNKAGQVKIADFGVAKMLGNGAEKASGPAGADNVTLCGGTPGYMAPEQKAAPQRVDSRADIYSLGVVFYEMLTGELPGKPLEPPSRKVQIDIRLDEVVLQALEREPEHRYQHVSEVRTKVQTIVAEGRAPERPPSTAAGTASALVERVEVGRAAYVVFLLLYLGYGAVLIASTAWLPERVASHFGSEGRANGWMSRSSYQLLTGAVPALFALIFAVVTRLIQAFPTLLNLPNRDYWMAPGRRVKAVAVIGHYLAWLLCLQTVFFGGLHGLTIVANREQPARLSMDGLLVLVMAFFVGLIVWIALLFKRFAETGGDRSEKMPSQPVLNPVWQSPTTGWGWLVGQMFGCTFTSPLAFKLANLSALGFLCFLGFVPLPGWRSCFGFSGFFGLIGAAFIVDHFARCRVDRRFILVGRCKGKAVIHWPGVARGFVLALAILESLAIVASVILEGRINTSALLIALCTAIMITGIRIRRGRTMPVGQLVSLDGKPLQDNSTPGQTSASRVRRGWNRP